MKCNKCDKEVEYDLPEPLCGEHWAEWWVADIPGEEAYTPEERTEAYAECMKLVNAERKKKR